LYKFFSKEIQKKELSSSLLRGYAVFFILAAPWIYFISEKENKFLFSSAGSNAMNLINPEINPDPFDDIHYDFEKGILSTPPAHAISAWIYPHRLTESWSPLRSKQDFFHYLKMVLRNVISVDSFHFGIDAGTVLVLALFLLLIFRKDNLKNFLHTNIFLLIACVTCTALYILLVTIHRYLWINDVAIIIMFSITVQKLFQWKRWLGFTFLTVFILLLLYDPIKSILENISRGEGVYQESQELKDYYHFGGRIISLTDNFPDRNHRLSHLVAYYTGSLYYGMAAEHNISEIEKEKIDYALDWSPAAHNWLEKNNLIDRTISFSGGDLIVYKIRHSPPQKD